MNDSRQPRRIKSVDRAFDIVEALRKNGATTISELAEEVDLSPGTIHTYLTTLESRGYVQSDDGVYSVGLFFLPMGEHARANTRLYEAGRSVADELAEETGEAIHLIVETNMHEIALYEQFGPNAVGQEIYMKNQGTPKRNLHCSAAGKAILAHLDDAYRAEILDDYSFDAYTQSTVTDPEQLREELATIRESGVALNDEEQISGLRAVGAPVLTESGVEGAISLSAPVSRVQGDRFESTFPNHVRQAANIIEVNLQAT
ncbi:IclR family transcriptional regulator [Halomarina salina]|uniref:IclR family transcriptional regulator n=1 Tax=Halomarina salina TaxID=1872699 RepID=A0ABD5RSQ7_9EURY|nr:IclR family transcriptional regulator [Halomarina salina]